VSPTLLWNDLRYAFRWLRKTPAFTVVAVLTLAIGIGANTTIFSVVQAVLLRPLPFRDPARLCLVTERMASVGPLGPSWENLQDWRAQNHSFEGIAAARNAPMTLTGVGEPERLQAQMASASLLPLLGVQPVRGRAFTEAEDQPGAANVVLLSHGFWQRRFGANDAVVGQAVTLDNQRYTVLGVLPPSFQLMQPADVVVPIGPWAAKLPDDRSWHPGIIAIGRLRQGVSIESARSEMSGIARRLEQAYPVYDTGVGADVANLQDQIAQNVRPALLALSGAVGLVLLIACANVAGLLLSRAIARRREIAVRTALGASGARLVVQLLAESAILSAVGGAGGVALAAAALPWLTRLAAGALPDPSAIRIDARVLLFTAAATALAAIFFGLAPALQSVRADLRSVLNESGRGNAGGGRHSGLRSLLVVAEMALALVLLIGAGLLLRSFERLQGVYPGFEAGNLLVADLPLSPRAHADKAERMAFFDRVLDGARAIPGVRSAGAASFLPVSGGGSIIHFNIQGRPPKTPHEYIMAGYRPSAAGYLETLRVPLLAGRYLEPRDTETAPFVAVVNRSMERQFFPGESALGKHIQLGATPTGEVPWMEIVGIVGDMKQNLATDPAAEMYIPIREANAVLPVFAVSLVLRTSKDPRNSAGELRQVVRQLDSNQPLVKVRTMEENVSANVSAPRFRTILLAIFALSALALSGVGLYGVIAYSVAQQAQEIGIRMALGARGGDVVRMVLGRGLRLAAAGAVLGVAGAIAATRLLASFLYGLTPLDPWTYAGVTALLGAVALLACLVPARRAVRVDPVVALRSGGA
jgi:putative ABC transport system permease protein